LQCAQFDDEQEEQPPEDRERASPPLFRLRA
jgi:hypothetical protein